MGQSLEIRKVMPWAAVILAGVTGLPLVGPLTLLVSRRNLGGIDERAVRNPSQVGPFS